MPAIHLLRMGKSLSQKAECSALTRRSLAAGWFASSAVIVTALYFLPVAMTRQALFLYILIPSVAAGIAGFVWGAAILRPGINSYAAALLRGAIVGVAGFVIFAGIYCCALPIWDDGWTLGRAWGLFILTLTLGALMGAPLSIVSGMVSGVMLFAVRRHLLN